MMYALKRTGRAPTTITADQEEEDELASGFGCVGF